MVGRKAAGRGEVAGRSFTAGSLHGGVHGLNTRRPSVSPAPRTGVSSARSQRGNSFLLSWSERCPIPTQRTTSAPPTREARPASHRRGKPPRRPPGRKDRVVTGFDVHAAAAEVWSTSSPGAAAAPAQRWTAIDYGWDPADQNAVAWAAYYSEQGLDPAAVAAQQAAEAAPAAEPEAGLAPSPALDLGADAPEAASPLDLAEPEPALGAPSPPDPEPLPELDFTPLAELELSPAAEASPAPPAADFEAAASSLWDLLPAAPHAAPPAAEQQAQLPGGWPGEDAPGRLDELHLAGGGSFDEATAPIADLAPEQLVEAYPPGVESHARPGRLPGTRRAARADVRRRALRRRRTSCRPSISAAWSPRRSLRPSSRRSPSTSTSSRTSWRPARRGSRSP